MLISCFALWGLLNNMTDNLVPAFERIFSIKPTESAGVQIAFYGAYAVLAVFAAILTEEFSYRTSVLTGLGIYILGALLYIPACTWQDLDTFLLGIFILAGGLSILETACNPYILALGPPKTAIRRLNFAQAFNPLGSLAGILIAKYAILNQLDTATPVQRAMMQEEELRSIINHELIWVCIPYIGLIIIALLIWLFFFRHKGINAIPSESQPECRMESGLSKSFLVALYVVCMAIPVAALVAVNLIKSDPGIFSNKLAQLIILLLGPTAFILLVRNYRHMAITLLKTPRYWGGVITQFFYVGVQIAVWTWMNKYCCQELSLTEAQSSTYYLLAIILFIICRWIATYYMKTCRPASMMSLFAAAALACCAGVMYLPTVPLFHIGGLPISANILCLVAMSGCMSLMFPTIYGIALSGLSSRTVKLGAAGLIIAILGGAVITPWMGEIIEQGSSSWLALVPHADNTYNTALHTSSQAIRASFIVPAICFFIVLAYSVLFRTPADNAPKQ